MNRRNFVLNSCATLIAVSRVEAAAVSWSDEEIHSILRHRVDVENRATGMAVGVIENGVRRLISYGRLDTGDARPVDPDTLFEIGSVTKIFTALLLADMVHRKRLRFEDPVDEYLPAGLRTPRRNSRAITLADLATHTSGLPFFPFDVRSTPRPLDVLAGYSISDLRSWLASLSLSFDPGDHYEYSNVGYGLLGLALANKAGCSFEALLEHRLSQPLGLKDTTFHPTRAAARRLAIGHDEKLVRVAPLDLGIFAPAGALRSTANDQLTFLQALMPNSSSPLEAPAQMLLSIRRPAPAAGGEQALGWDVVTGPDPFLAKDGLTAGYAASVVLDPAKQTGIVVLSNAFPTRLGPPPSGGVGAADLARHLLRPALPLG